jgi:hypothetical protein
VRLRLLLLIALVGGALAGPATASAGRGAVIGRVAAGRVVVTRKAGYAAPSGYVRGCNIRRRGTFGSKLVCKGNRTISLYVHGGRWRVRIRGRGINVSGVVTGTLVLRDGEAGTYWVSGMSRRLAWPEFRRIRMR